jgi:hypothetical protein
MRLLIGVLLSALLTTAAIAQIPGGGGGGGGGGCSSPCTVIQPTASLLNETETNSGSILTAVEAPSKLTDGTNGVVGVAPASTAPTTAQPALVVGLSPNSLLTQGVIGNATAPTDMSVAGLVYNSTPLTLTNGQSSALQGDSNGWLNVHIQAGAGSGGTAAADNSAWTEGTTNQTPAGCEYTSGGATALTTAHTGTVGCTSARQQFVAISGNTGAILDFAGQNAASPANALLMGGQFNTTPTTITSGNTSPFQLDNAGNLLVNVKAGGGSGGTSSNFSATFPSAGTAAGAEYLSSAPSLTSGQMVALQVTSAGSLHATVDNSNNNGQATMANSSPVAIASNQSSLTVNGGAASGAALSGNPVLVAGGNGTDAYTLKTDTLGDLFTNLADVGGTAIALGQTTMSASLPVAIASNQSAVPVSPTTYPATAVPITAAATGTTAATTATLTNVSGHTTYICGFSIRANATAAATGNATVTGTITGTLDFTQWTAPNASGLGVTEELFSPCVPASAVSTSIAVVSAAPGTGGVVSVSAWGYSI